MKRMTLRIDEALLAEALRLSGAKSASAIVGRALDEFVRRIEARTILAFAGSGLSEGDLAAMREDRTVRPHRRR